MKLAAVVTAGGFAGSLLDSLLGATLQAQYAAEHSGDGSAVDDTLTVSEHRWSSRGLPNRLVRGLSFMNNDVVNLASCASVTLAAVLLTPVLF